MAETKKKEPTAEEIRREKLNSKWSKLREKAVKTEKKGK